MPFQFLPFAIGAGASLLGLAGGLNATNRQNRLGRNLMRQGNQYGQQADSLINEQLGLIRDFDPYRVATASARSAGLGVNRGQYEMGYSGTGQNRWSLANMANMTDQRRTAQFINDATWSSMGRKLDAYSPLIQTNANRQNNFTSMGAGIRENAEVGRGNVFNQFTQGLSSAGFYGAFGDQMFPWTP